jgi:hypothetical protein
MTGVWNAATDDSGGWQSFDADLSAYAGRRVEISISEMSDGFSNGFGAFLDDVRVDVDGATVTRTSFESDPGGWAVGGPPPGSPDTPVNWMRSRHACDLGAATATADTLYLGFGLENARVRPLRRDGPRDASPPAGILTSERNPLITFDVLPPPGPVR